jgi:hypothetical protein
MKQRDTNAENVYLPPIPPTKSIDSLTAPVVRAIMGDVIHLPAPEVIVKKSGDRVEISAARKETTPFAAPPPPAMGQG